MTPKLFLVGGSVRDKLLNKKAKDFDFAVEAPSYEDMLYYLKSIGMVAFQERPEFVTVRGKLPLAGAGWPQVAELHHAAIWVPADFTLCREEAQYADKRHPSLVTPTDIMGDLKRRDFTINAIAIDEEGKILDPYLGKADLIAGVIRCVGSPNERFEEDPLRILRALRFSVVLDMRIENYTSVAMWRCAPLIKTLPVERVREELHKMFKHNWYDSMEKLFSHHNRVTKVIMDSYPNLWLKPTTEE